MLRLDFETYSACDIRAAGADAYAEHPTTGVHCLGGAINDEPVDLWLPGDPDPQRWLDWIAARKPVGVWNAPFELLIWQHVVKRRWPHWPDLLPEQTHCTMAAALNLALPGSLENAGAAMRLEIQKDTDGARVMKAVATPAGYEADGSPRWCDDFDKYARLFAYCRRDVETEREAGKKLAALSKRERAMWLLDYRINRRGIALDLVSIRRASRVIEKETVRLNEELAWLTNYACTSVTAPAQITAWLRSRGIEADSLRKDQIEALKKSAAADAFAVRVLEIRQEGGKASTAKLKAMEASASADGRARGLLAYYGATTGRWAGRRVQPQNLPRPTLDQPDIERAIALLGHPDAAAELRREFKSATEAVASSLRGMFIPAAGHTFVGADFSNIEGRVLAWLAGETWKLEAFRAYDAGEGADLYKLAYARSFGCKPEDVDKDKRQIGKVQELALGYQGGVGAFASMAAGYNADLSAIAAATRATISDVEWSGFVEKVSASPRGFADYSRFKDRLTLDEWLALKYVVSKWRLAHPSIVKYWYDLDQCAMSAISKPGDIFITATGSTKFLFRGQFLYCQLPSGRTLAYPDANIGDVQDDVTKKWRPAVRFKSQSSTTRRWGSEVTYGGKLAENVTQATARDILADSLLRCEAAGLPVVLHVHDEVLCEVPADKADVHALENLLCASEPWAAGLPVAAEGWCGSRYQK